MKITKYKTKVKSPINNILKPTYQIFNNSCTQVTWPINADLFISKLPSSKADGYSKGLIGFIANKAYYSLNNNSLAFVIVSSLKEDKTIPFEIIKIFISAGFKYIDQIIWYKNKFTPTQGGKRLNNVYDSIFMFAKGTNYHLNRSAIAYLKNNLYPDNSHDYKCAGNLWFIKVNRYDTLPYELIKVIIQLANLLPNSLIIDPMMDVGVTCRAALNSLHSFWGCEADKRKYKQCKRVIKEFLYTHTNKYRKNVKKRSKIKRNKKNIDKGV